MRGLLDLPTQRLIKLVETLASEDRWFPIPELVERVDSSYRSVADDLTTLKKRWGDKLQLESARSLGVRMHNQNMNSIGLVFMDLFNESVPLKWLREIFAHPKQTIEFYEDRLFTSKSTLRRHLPRINQFLANYQMKIHNVKNHYEVRGRNEAFLRDFFATFLLELNGIDLQSFDLGLDITVLFKLVYQDLAQKLDPLKFQWVQNDDVVLVYQVMYFLISLIRENQGYHIRSSYDIQDRLDEESFEYLKQFFPALRRSHCRPIYEYMHKMYEGWDSKEEQDRVQRASENYTNHILEETGLQVDDDLHYLLCFVPTNVYLKGKTRPYKTSSLFDRTQNFAVALKKANPALYQILDESASQFFIDAGLKTDFMNDSVTFWLCLTCPTLYQYSRPKTALLLSGLGRAHASFLVEVLENFYNRDNFTNIRVAVGNIPEVMAEATYNDYDFIITTIPNMDFPGKKVYLIPDYPDINDLNAIYHTLLEG